MAEGTIICFNIDSLIYIIKKEAVLIVFLGVVVVVIVW
jgi:hypothetical protein